MAVDDTRDMLAPLVTILSAEGYVVMSADSGEAALAVVREKRPDLILLDIQMAGMDGLEVCRRLKADAAIKNIPVILMSAFADTETWATGLQLGAVDYISKPFRNAELLSRVATHLSLAEMKRTLEQQAGRLREVEESALEVESRYLELFENSPIGKSMTSIDGMVMPNQALCDMLGYTFEELRSMNWQDITPPEDIGFTSESINALLEGSVSKAHFGKRYIRKDGSILWGEVLSYMHRDKQGRPLHFITSVTDITERKRAVLALEERTMFADALMEATALSTWISDESGTAIKANRACYDFFGASEEEVIGKYNVFRDELVEIQGAMPKVRHAYTTGEPVKFFLDYDFGSVEHVKVRNATHKFIQVNLTPIKDKTGKVINVVSQSIDLTDMRRNEEALRESKRKLSEAQAMAQLGYWEWDIATGKVEWSEEVYRIFRLDPNEFTPEIGSIMALSPWPEDHERDKELIGKVMQNREKGAYEQRFLRPDKSIGYYYSTFQGKYDDTGKLAAIVGTVLDITGRKVAALQLESNYSLLKAIVNSSRDLVIFSLNTEYRYTTFNDKHRDEMKLVWNADINIGDNILDHMSVPELRAAAMASMDRALSGESFMEIQHQPGPDIFYEFIWNPVCLNTEITGVTCFIRDITDRKRAEEALAESERRLHQSQKMEAIGQLAGGVAHDFNNILGGITGYADLFKLKYRDDPETRGYAEKITQSAQKASNLTRQLLTFARKAPLEKMLFDAHESILSVVDMFKQMIDSRIAIETELAAIPSLLMVDQSMFENCLLNLCINARDAMPDGGLVAITTTLIHLEEKTMADPLFTCIPGLYFRIIVSDSGTGMDEATRKRIFEPFFTTKAPGKGTGLGLASVYGFVKQHDGYIVVQSSPGGGARFIVYLPV